MNHQSGNIPHHQYLFVDSRFITKDETITWLPAVWFGLVSIPGRMWGLNVMLECGAMYRNVPPHAVAFENPPKGEFWTQHSAQRWDCYGSTFSTLEYTYLRGLDCQCKIDDSDHYPGEDGQYLFTAVPIDDGFSRDPSQSKEFMFVRLYNGRLTIQPTDKVLFRDKSFTSIKAWPPSSMREWPTNLKRNDRIYSCE